MARLKKDWGGSRTLPGRLLEAIIISASFPATGRKLSSSLISVEKSASVKRTKFPDDERTPLRTAAPLPKFLPSFMTVRGLEIEFASFSAISKVASSLPSSTTIISPAIFFLVR